MKDHIVKKKIIINLTEDWFFVSHFIGRALDEKMDTKFIFLVMKKKQKIYRGKWN